MLRFYTLLLFTFSGSVAVSQPYLPMLDSVNRWSYSSSLVPVSQPENAASACQWPLIGGGMKYLTNGDTLANGNQYLRLFADLYGTGMNYCHAGYIREDTVMKQVFVMESMGGAERLLYDFSMVPGDSIYVNATTQFTYFPAGYYRLDSITQYPLVNNTTRAFYLYRIGAGPFSSPLIWLEGVGFPGELVYDLEIGNFGFGLFSWCNSLAANWYSYAKVLTCFDHTDRVYFDSCAYAYAMQNASCFNIQDSCSYWNICGSVPELSSVVKVKIHPNPASDNVILEMEVLHQESLVLRVLDITGRTSLKEMSLNLKPGEQLINLQIGELPAGIYMVQLKGQTKQTNVRLVKY